MHEFYVLKDEIWLQAHHSRVGMLCVGCIERRLGRMLRPSDFADCYLNRRGGQPMSLRLGSRIALSSPY